MYGHQGRRGGGMNWDIGIDLYTLLCMEWVTSENLLYRMGNSTQCFMVT